MSVTVGVRKFRENLSHYLDIVKSGTNSVIITERGRPVARLSGPSNSERMIARTRRPRKLVVGTGDAEMAGAASAEGFSIAPTG